MTTTVHSIAISQNAALQGPVGVAAGLGSIEQATDLWGISGALYDVGSDLRDPDLVEAASGLHSESIASPNGSKNLFARRDDLVRVLSGIPNSERWSEAVTRSDVDWASYGLRRFSPLVETVRSKLLSSADSEMDADVAYRATQLYFTGPQKDLDLEWMPIRAGVSAATPLTTPKPRPRVLTLSIFPGGNGSWETNERVIAELDRNGAEVSAFQVDFRAGAAAHHSTYHYPVKHPFEAPLVGAAGQEAGVFHANKMFPNGIRFRDMTREQWAATAEGLADGVATAVAHMRPSVLLVNHAAHSAMAAARTGLPFVVVCHGSCLFEVDQARRHPDQFPAHFLDKILPYVRQAARVVTASRPVADLIPGVYGVPAERVKVIPHGYDSNTFKLQRDLVREDVLLSLGISPLRETHLVTYAGRLAEIKGLKELLLAIRTIHGVLSEAHFVLAGGGATLEVEGYKQMAVELGIADVVHFVGQRSHAELARLYAVSDVVAVPSRRELFSLVAVEAAATGTPIVATGVDGLRDVVSGSIGEIVDVQGLSYPAVAHAFADTMLGSLLTNLKRRKGPKAISDAVRGIYDWKLSGDSYFYLLQRVIEEHAAGKPYPVPMRRRGRSDQGFVTV